MALYSFLCGMVPFILFGLCFSSSASMKRELKRADDTKEVKRIYDGMKKRIKCTNIARLVFFVLLSSFLLLFIVCFCHVATGRMAEDWIRSSGILLVLDLIVLEIVPGVIFGVLALVSVCSKSNKGVLCCLVSIEVYRVYRNLVEV